MNPFQRMDLLSKDAASELPPAQIDKINNEGADAVAELVAENGNRKQVFLMLVSQALSAMTAYVDELQAEEGLKILQQVAQGNEPKPVFRNLVHPRSNVYQRWKVFYDTVISKELPTERKVFYAGAASMYGLIADRWPEIGSPAGTEFMEDLQIELQTYVQKAP